MILKIKFQNPNICNQKSPLTLFDRKPADFKIKIDTKDGPLKETIKLAKIGNYDVINATDGITLDEKEAFSLTYTARFASFDNLLLDIDVTTKKAKFNGRLDHGKFCEKSGTIKVDLLLCGSTSDSVMGNLKMDYLFVYPIRLQADDPIDVMWPSIGCSVFQNFANFIF